MANVQSIEKKFRELFNENPLILRSPGRVNIIGEHTDYNMGFVLPGAIDKAIYFAIAPRTDNKCFLYAYDINDNYEFSIDDVKRSDKNWANYLIGIVDQLNKNEYKINGFNCVFGGDIPIGAGLSSSAAIEAGLAYALNYIFDLKIDKLDLVKLSQKSENEFVGVKCGIMDQYINIFGEENKVLKIDCRSLEYEYIPFEFKNISIVLFNTGVSHSLASSEYNQRRKECKEGVQIIQKDFPDTQSLRDVTLEMIYDYKNKMPEKIFNRCKYVVEENNRLLKACDALKKKDLPTVGNLMYQTHEGLSKDYEVSCKELDFLVELTKNEDRIFGARMMGGGFGGCTINLIEKNDVNDICNFFAERYKRKFGIELKYYITSINKGTSFIKVYEDATI
ncbi:MAG: galactokinase [Melioribacter sp.]|uniref:galactokinase n=1 Tax=Rosettibacter primus TaxID=3111523 RepID=UPI00247C19E3|nr:galactokinase [Melioribacter sp.]